MLMVLWASFKLFPSCKANLASLCSFFVYTWFFAYVFHLLYLLFSLYPSPCHSLLLFFPSQAFFTLNECVFILSAVIIMHVFKLCRLILHHHHHHHTLHCSSWNNPGIGNISCFKVKSRETDEQGVCYGVCVCLYHRMWSISSWSI